MENVLQAVHDAVIDFGPKDLARKIGGISHTTLLNNANPNDDTHRMNLPQFLQVLLHTGDMRPLKALAESFGFELVSRQAPEAREVTAALVSMHKEVADVTHVVTEALGEAHLSQIQRKATVREITEAIEALQTLLVSVEAA